MIQRMLSGGYRRIEMHHVRMAFSDQIHDVGTFRWSKLGEVVRVIRATFVARRATGADTLYYPPAAGGLGVVRDLVVLIAVRWRFRHLVLHFHASGLAEHLASKPLLIRLLGSWAYGKPCLAIVLSERNPPDAQHVSADVVRCVPYGIPDAAPVENVAGPRQVAPPRILYVGMVVPGKGIDVLCEASEILSTRGVDHEVRLVGEIADPGLQLRLNQRLATGRPLRLLGVLTDEPKLDEYRNATVFCFPTHYEAESFGVVLLEAMQHRLPVVATDWRGVPDVVVNGDTGFVVPAQDPKALADALEEILTKPELARYLGDNGRRRYEEQYSEEVWIERLEDAILEGLARCRHEYGP